MLPTGSARLHDALPGIDCGAREQLGVSKHLLPSRCLTTEIDDPRSAIADQLHCLIRAAHGNVHYAGN